MIRNMLNPNLGTRERGLRLLGAIILSGWVFTRGSFDVLAVIAGIAALALLANAIFSRCYLWAMLGISTCDRESDSCGKPPEGS